jgi:hypothetical protein
MRRPAAAEEAGWQRGGGQRRRAAKRPTRGRRRAQGSAAWRRGGALVLHASRRRWQLRRPASGEEVDEEACGKDEGGQQWRARSTRRLAAGVIVDRGWAKKEGGRREEGLVIFIP